MDRSRQPSPQPPYTAVELPVRGVPEDDDDELVAAVPADDVAWVDGPPQPRRGRAQQTVTGVVTQRVVGGLQAVQIDEEHRAQPSAICRRQPVGDSAQ